jgi:cytochrome P450
MRLYPPAWIVGRRAVDDVAIGDVAIRAGEVTLMSPFAVHRDPRYYDEPLAFRPERWLVERELPKFAYFPFGGGNRVCIGESFAWMEAVLVLATIARRWAMTLEPGTPVATAPSVTLRPKYPMPMRLSRVS